MQGQQTRAMCANYTARIGAGHTAMPDVAHRNDKNTRQKKKTRTSGRLL